jgi:peptidoglycan/xylan/chitin deacetylase (PgdA/CDA1 family)/uncharacterized protein YcfL
MKKWQLGIIAMIVVVFMITGCSSTKVAVAKVKKDLLMNHMAKADHTMTEKNTKEEAKSEVKTVENQDEQVLDKQNANDLETVQNDDEIGDKETIHTPHPMAEIYKTTEFLNIREGASTKARKISTIPKGEVVTFISKSGAWYKVAYGSTIGYVSSNYLADNFNTDTTSTVKAATDGSYSVPILMYHAIDEYKGNGLKELYVSPEYFEAQMNYLKSAGFTPLHFDDLNNISKVNKPILITFDDGYKNNMNAFAILKNLNDSNWKAKGTIFMIGKKIDTNSGLSSEQLKVMSDSGIISIQSHTETHPSLPTITNYMEELGNIKTKLEQITGKKVTAIAYPSGKYDHKVIEETKKYYDYAVTTVPGVADIGLSPYEMKRIRINNSTSLSTFIDLVEQK